MKALFLDRDGVINIDYGFVHKRENFQFVDGIHELVQSAKAKGYAIVIVTNQSGIGRGLYTEADFHTLMDWLKTELPFDALYYSPEHPDADSYDRKPNPGMMLRAAKDLGIDLKNSLLIGDRETDIQAAKNAAIGTSILLNPEGNPTAADVSIGRLAEVQGLL